ADQLAFEREMQSDVVLRTQVERQRLINDSLQRLFSPPARANLTIEANNGKLITEVSSNGSDPRLARATAIPITAAPNAAPPTKPVKKLRLWPVAAAIIIGLGIAWWLSEPKLGPSPSDYKQPGPVIGGPESRNLAAVYDEQIK